MEENMHTESCNQELETEASGSEENRVDAETTEVEKEEKHNESEPAPTQGSPKALPAPCAGS